jgi:hypothetical protein
MRDDCPMSGLEEGDVIIFCMPGSNQPYGAARAVPGAASSSYSAPVSPHYVLQVRAEPRSSPCLLPAPSSGGGYGLLLLKQHPGLGGTHPHLLIADRGHDTTRNARTQHDQPWCNAGSD